MQSLSYCHVGRLVRVLFPCYKCWVGSQCPPSWSKATGRNRMHCWNFLYPPTYHTGPTIARTFGSFQPFRVCFRILNPSGPYQIDLGWLGILATKSFDCGLKGWYFLFKILQFSLVLYWQVQISGILIRVSDRTNLIIRHFDKGFSRDNQCYWGGLLLLDSLAKYKLVNILLL